MIKIKSNENKSSNFYAKSLTPEHGNHDRHNPLKVLIYIEYPIKLLTTGANAIHY